MEGIMTVSVIYQSRGGKTKMIADAIAEECGTEALDVNIRHTLDPGDLLIVGCGIYAGKPDESLLNYLEKLPVGKIRKAAVFSTSATGKDRTELIVSRLRNKGIDIIDEHFACKGKFLFLAGGHPDQQDLDNAREFARRAMKIAKYEREVI